MTTKSMTRKLIVTAVMVVNIGIAWNGHAQEAELQNVPPSVIGDEITQDVRALSREQLAAAKVTFSRDLALGVDQYLQLKPSIDQAELDGDYLGLGLAYFEASKAYAKQSKAYNHYAESLETIRNETILPWMKTTQESVKAAAKTTIEKAGEYTALIQGLQAVDADQLTGKERLEFVKASNIARIKQAEFAAGFASTMRHVRDAKSLAATAKALESASLTYYGSASDLSADAAVLQSNSALAETIASSGQARVLNGYAFPDTGDKSERVKPLHIELPGLEESEDIKLPVDRERFKDDFQAIPAEQLAMLKELLTAPEPIKTVSDQGAGS